jgi:signal transduction histidine kinase
MLCHVPQRNRVSCPDLGPHERLAQELHDGVAQDMAVVGFGLDAVHRRLREERPDLAEEVAAVRAVLDQSIGALRVSIARLRSAEARESQPA